MQLDKIKIMGREYRVIHLLTFVAAFALLFTGIGSSPGNRLGIPFSAISHDVLGIVSIIVITVYSGYLFINHGVRLFDGLRKSFSDQFAEAKAILRNYTLGASLPSNVKQGLARHNVLASYASILLVIGFGELAVTGIFLVFLKAGSSLYDTIVQFHNIGVFLSAAFFFLHLFAVLKGENRPLLRAVFTNGTVPLNWAKEHMAKFLNKES